MQLKEEKVENQMVKTNNMAFNDIKWLFMVDWLAGDSEARDENTSEILANVLVGGVFTSTQHNIKR